MAFEIRPYIGVGPLKLGMSRQEVRQAIGDEWRTTPGRGSEPPGDFFSKPGIVVDYRVPDICDFIEFVDEESPTLQGQAFLHLPYQDVYEWLVSRDPDILLEEGVLRSPAFGLALYVPDAKTSRAGQVKAVAIYEEGYYERGAVEAKRRVAEMMERARRRPNR